MSTALLVILAVACFLFVMRKAIVRVLALLLLRKAVRAGLGEVGRTALEKIEERITLSPEESYSWKSDGVEDRYLRPLRDLGFRKTGAYSVHPMPGVHVEILVHVDDRIQANVLEHPLAGDWLELVSRRENDEVFTVTDLKPQGVDRPEWLHTFEVEKGMSVVSMVQLLLKERKSGRLKPMDPRRAKEEFENGYARFMAWKKKTGVSAEEVARQIQRRLEEPEDSLAAPR
jgi:hypothetical protein